MAKVVGEVAIDVTADVGPLIRQMARGEGAMDGLRAASAKAARGLDKFGDNAVRLGTGLSIATAGIAAAAGAAFALTKNVADSGDATAKFARGAGVSTDYFQEMAFAIGQVAAVSKDELAAGMTRVTKLLGEAQMGSKSAITAFEQIGISQSELASGTVTSEAAFSKMLQTLSDTKDPAIAAAVATDLLGRSGADLGGKLAGSSGEIAKMRDRAHELGIVMSTEALNASEKFGDKLDEMQNGFQGLRVAIANELMPVFVNVLIPAMIEKVIPALQEVVKQIGTVIEWFAGLPGPVLEAAALIGTALGLGGPILIGIGLVSSALSLLIASTGPIGLFIAAASLIVAAWMTWGDDIKSIISTVAEFITTAFADGLAAVVGFGQSARDAVGGAVTFMSDQFNVFLEYVRTIPAQLLEIGSQMIQGLLDGIMLKWEELKAKIYELGAMLPQWMREMLDIQSPSRVFHEIGGYIGQGLANGIAESSALVNAAVSVLTDGAVASTQGMATQIMSTLGTLFQGSKKFAIAQALVNAWTGATEALRLPFPQNIVAFEKVLGTGLNAVKNIKSAKPGGGGGGSSAGSGAAPAAPQSVANISLVGDTFSRNSIEGLFTQINDGLRQGRVINLVRA
jgi:hypothetical protein